MEVFVEDLELDRPYTFGTYLVSREEIVTFAAQWDPLPIHVDEAAAAAGPFGEVIASGIHTFGIFQHLAVKHVYRGWRLIAGRRVSDLAFARPVRPGMTLTGDVRITRIDPRDATRSLVHKHGELRDLEGNLVFSLRVEAYMARRGP